jgi:hypothetical protein
VSEFEEMKDTPNLDDEMAKAAEAEAAARAERERAQAVTENDREVEKAMRTMSRRSFLWAAIAAGTGYGGIRWLASRRLDDGVPWPLRQGLQFNDGVARDLFSQARLAPTFPMWRAEKDPRVNGDLGLPEDFDPKGWTLQVQGLAGDNSSKTVTLKEIQALPRVEMVTEFKCIEGWSMILHWAGARLSDFMAKYPPATNSGDPLDLAKRPNDLPQYVGLSTPDGGYYVGLDMESALHPQTLLCYEMNGVPLTLEHGAPLRLAIPVKYGVKNIKRIGTITYSNVRPADYWAEQGYDYYAGH